MEQKLKMTITVTAKIIFFLVILSVFLAGLTAADQWRLRQSISGLQASNKTLEEDIGILEKAGKVGELFQAKMILERAEKERITWSKVAETLFALEKSVAEIRFVQVSVAEDGLVQIGGLSPNLQSISILLQKIRQSSDFRAPFTPTISGEAGQYNFQLQFYYRDLP